MTKLFYSLARGAPPVLPGILHRPQQHPYTWACWEDWPPILDPLPRPVAHGGSPDRDSVLELVRRGRPHDTTCWRVADGYARMWRKLWIDEVEGRASWADYFRERSEAAAREDEARRQAHGDLFGFCRGPAVVVPPWAQALDLPWPSFSPADVDRSFRARALDAHPDRGGDHETFVRLNDARRQALRHLEARS